MIAATALAGCSSEPAPASDRAEPASAPAGTARLLSLGSHLVEEGGTSAELAFNCAVALRVTEVAVAPLTTAANADQMELIKRASEIYTRRAVGTEAGRTEREVTTDIARQTRAKMDEKSEQAQLAIVCLRGLKQR
ncbi:hypothetical protein [Pseudoblastomonas halimionae]|uniref:Uncharacterized protein n=1 Tax=Alteriqipengyuania halimionae TaxID=1926630 RepID=A0A6I4U9H6_9SPHN|nr:hypothetical protein [Alteriqipengyuania halimionae]MXP10897.1 hypothetical protein [Alteriqipengyuania halimionae]